MQQSHCSLSLFYTQLCLHHILFKPRHGISRGVTGIFFRRSKLFFLIFSRCEILFPFRKFPFWYTQNKFQWFFHFQFSTFPSLFRFSFFSSPFFLFSLPLFPSRSAEVSRWEMSGGALPPLLAVTLWEYPIFLWPILNT